MRLHAPESNRIFLNAVTDAGAKELFWFADNQFIGKSAPASAIEWKPSPGAYTLRAVDDAGRSDSVKVRVAVAD